MTVGIKASDDDLRDWADRGLIRPDAAPPARPKRGRVKLVGASFTNGSAPRWEIPLRVTAGDNARGQKARIGRAGHERRVVSRHLGGATLYALAAFAWLASRGKVVTVRLTRLGPVELDGDNAVASLKYTRDCVALMMGFSDDPRSPLRFVVSQERCDEFGVRIELSEGV